MNGPTHAMEDRNKERVRATHGQRCVRASMRICVFALAIALIAHAGSKKDHRPQCVSIGAGGLAFR